MNIQTCPYCGANIINTESIQRYNFCPYCGNTVDLCKDNDSNDEKYRIIPFKITEHEAINFLTKELVRNDNVPIDVFRHIKIEAVKKYALPMYLFNGAIEGTWTATAIIQQSRRVKRSDGLFATEYYNVSQPISGTGRGAFWLMSIGNVKTELPHNLRQFAHAIEFTHEHSKFSFLKSTSEIPQLLRDDVAEIYFDTERMTVFQSEDLNNAIHHLATQLAVSQLPQSYKDFMQTWNAQCNYSECVLLSVYYIIFSYKGQEYYYCVDGIGNQAYLNPPQDSSSNKAFNSTRKFQLALTIIIGILSLGGGIFISPFMPIVGFFFVFLMVFLINKEYKETMFNRRALREYGRRIFSNESTNDLNIENPNGTEGSGCVNTGMLVAAMIILIILFCAKCS